MYAARSTTAPPRGRRRTPATTRSDASSALVTDGALVLSNRQFAYDPLGNTLNLTDAVGAGDAALSYRPADRDRVCRIGYGNGGLGGSACNVTHDSAGNVLTQPTRTGSRTLTWLASGQVKSIVEGNAKATFRYDPFGSVQELDLEGSGVADTRHDRRYGSMIERRDQLVAGVTQSVISRHVPGQAGVVATRRGAGGPWIFQHADLRGARFVTDAAGAFVQDLEYLPFGEATSTGAQPGSAEYANYQWNDGDALAAFGLHHLGARVYDPVIGRFLGRDPMRFPRTAARTSPYAFALNDPVNLSDPTGLDVECHGSRCDGGGPRPTGDEVPAPGSEVHGIPAQVGSAELGGKPQGFTPVWERKDAPRFFKTRPTYDSTYDRGLARADLTDGEKQIFAAELEKTRRPTWAYAAVTADRHARRYKGVLVKSLAESFERFAIAAANSRRVLMFTGKDREKWRRTANVTPPLALDGAYEVWVHGNVQEVAKGDNWKVTPLNVVVDNLTRAGWTPGMPIVLAACESGERATGVASELAKLSGSVVIAAVGRVVGPAQGPASAPYGWSIFFPNQ